MKKIILPLILLLVGASLYLAFGDSPVPGNKPDYFPGWWFSRNVIMQKNPPVNTPSWPGNYPVADDFAAANLGQLKQVATAAYDELNAHLPGGAGSSLDTLVKGWFQVDASGDFLLDANGNREPLVTAQTDDFAVLNLGQLKTVAQPFYDCLIAVHYIAGYPWESSGLPPDDFAAVNLGQLKYLFSFDLTYSSLGDGVPDWWKLAAGLMTNDANAISFLTGNTTLLASGQPITYAQAYQLGYDPITAATSDPANNPPPGQGSPLKDLPTVTYAAIDVSTAYTPEDVSLVGLDDIGRVGFYYLQADGTGSYTHNGVSFFQGGYPFTESFPDQPTIWKGRTIESVNSSGRLAGMTSSVGGYFVWVMVDGTDYAPDDYGISGFDLYSMPSVSINLGNSGLAMGPAGGYNFEMANGNPQWLVPAYPLPSLTPYVFSPSGIAAGSYGTDLYGTPVSFAVGDYNTVTLIGLLAPLALSDNGLVVGDDEHVQDDKDCLSVWDGATTRRLSSLLPGKYANKIRFPRNSMYAANPEAWINANGDIVIDAKVLDDTVPNSTTWVPRKLLWQNALNRVQNVPNTIAVASFPTNTSRAQFNAQRNFAGITYETDQDHLAAALLVPLTVRVTNTGYNRGLGPWNDGNNAILPNTLLSPIFNIVAEISPVPGIDIHLDIDQDISLVAGVWYDDNSSTFLTTNGFLADYDPGDPVRHDIDPANNNIRCTFVDEPYLSIGPVARPYVRYVQYHGNTRDYITLQIGTGPKQVIAEVDWNMALAASFGPQRANGVTVFQPPAINGPYPLIGNTVFGAIPITQPVNPRVPSANDYLKFSSGHWLRSGGRAISYPIGNFQTPFSQ